MTLILLSSSKKLLNLSNVETIEFETERDSDNVVRVVVKMVSGVRVLIHDKGDIVKLAEYVDSYGIVSNGDIRKCINLRTLYTLEGQLTEVKWLEQ